MPKVVTQEDYLEKCKDLLDEGYEILSDYNGTHNKMTYKCPNGHTFERIAKDFLRYKTCPHCSGRHRYTTEEFKIKVKELSNNECELVGEYISTKTKTQFKCNICNHFFNMAPTNFIIGQRCPECKRNKNRLYYKNLKISNKEKELRDFISSFYKKQIIFNDMTVIPNDDLDIYLPEDNIAFEFNGLFSHSEEASNGKCNKWYHYNKSKLCEEKGVRLIHIFEDDWDNHKKQLKSKIKYILHYSNNLPRIRASKCYIKEVNNNKKDKFLNKHHIQGNDRGTSVNLGLFSRQDKQLLAIMTFTKLNNKNNKENDYNLSRFASHNKYIINGAFSKLLKYFLDNYKTDDIFTFADKTWSVGDLYNKNNFEVYNYIDPDYSYYKNTEHELGRQHKFNYRKNRIKIKHPDIYDDAKTERQMMQEAGYVRIWNCGLIKYKLKKEED